VLQLKTAWGYGVGFDTLYFFGRSGGTSLGAPCVFITPQRSARAPLFGLVALANLRRRCHATDSERVQDVFLKIFDQTFPPMALSLLWYRSKVT